jgi:hypothetical protein
MNAHQKGSLTIVVAIIVVIAAAFLTACRETADDEAGASASGSTVSAAQDAVATTEGGEQNTSQMDSSGGLPAGEQERAVDIARAYFVAKTDFTGDQFDWKLEAAAQDNEGSWWARVSATPKDGISSDTVQIYVKLPAGMELWVAHGMSPDVDPATDKNMPDEVRDRL